MRYKINSPMVIADDVDHEVIILNMKSGKYYSASNSSGIFWNMISGGYSIDELKKTINNPELNTEIDDFVEFLISESLIVEDLEIESHSKVEIPEEIKFDKLKIDTYTDMEQILLLDPIHEVENIGWPSKKNESNT